MTETILQGECACPRCHRVVTVDIRESMELVRCPEVNCQMDSTVEDWLRTNGWDDENTQG